MDGRWLLLCLVAGAIAAVRWRRRVPENESAPASDAVDGLPSPRDGADPGDPGDRGERGDLMGLDGIDAALERVWSEHASEAGTLLDARLRQIVRRGVPARAIRPAPGTRTVRVLFADGTVLLCRGSGHGDFGRLGLALLHHSVRLTSYTREAGGSRLEFRWSPDQRLAAVAVGLDQPD